jgi:hypothetical protein
LNFDEIKVQTQRSFKNLSLPQKQAREEEFCAFASMWV